jgi:hypothetical protein
MSSHPPPGFVKINFKTTTKLNSSVDTIDSKTSVKSRRRKSTKKKKKVKIATPPKILQYD